MATLVILIALAFALAILDYSWVSITLIATAALLASRAATAFQNWVENRTGRRPDLKSEKYAATYYLILLGILLPVGIYFFPSIHPLAYGALGLFVFSAATAIGTIFFGRQELEAIKKPRPCRTAAGS